MKSFANLSEFIQWLRSELKNNPSAFTGEEEIKIGIVQPILTHLGWNVGNSSYVFPEYSPTKGKGRVDYGLLIPERELKLQCVIEAKRKSINLDSAEDQLFEYISREVPPLAVLTNGRKWRFYRPGAFGEYKERLIHALDIEKDPPKEVVRRFDRYLSFEKTNSGEATEHAELDHKEIATKKHISKAWARIRSSDKLIALLTEETRRIFGAPPQRKYVEEFLKNLGGHECKPETGQKLGKIQRLIEFLTPLIEEGKYTRKQLQKKAEERFKGDIAVATIRTQLNPKNNKFSFPMEVDERTKVLRFIKKVPGPADGAVYKKSIEGASFVLFNTEYEKKDRASAFIEVMKVLANKDQSFLERLAPELARRKTQCLSRNLADMSKSDQKAAKPLVDGWWLTTRSSTKKKRSMFREICKVAGIPYGNPQGLKIINF